MRREVGDDVGRDVRVRIAHLVHELLGHRRDRDPAAGVRMLVDDERAVGVAFDDRIADVREVGNVLPIVEAVAARALRAAFDDVAGDDSRGESIPVVAGPAELVAQRRHRERGVGRAAGDDDVRAARERLDDRHRADVRVGRQHAIANGGERLARLHVRERDVRRAISSSMRGSRSSPVTTPIRTLSATPCFCATSRTAAAQAGGFTPPALAMTRTPRVGDRRQHALDRADEVARVAHLRVALLLLLQNAHRDFGEVVEHQVVDVAALDLAARRLEPVAPEALARRDANDAACRS